MNQNNMSVTLTFVETNGEIAGSFEAEDNKSINQMAEQHGIDIPIACCRGACYVCACKIKQWNEYIQIDKITSPAVLPARDEQWNRKEVFTCIGGIKSDAIHDQESHEIILEKRF